MKKKLNFKIHGRVIAAALSVALALPIILSFGALAADTEATAPISESISQSVIDAEISAEQTPNSESMEQEADASIYQEEITEPETDSTAPQPPKVPAEENEAPESESTAPEIGTEEPENDKTAPEISEEALNVVAEKAFLQAPKQDILPPYTMSLFSAKEGIPGEEITGGEISLDDDFFIRIKWDKLEGVTPETDYMLRVYSDKLTAATGDGSESFKTSGYPGAPSSGTEFVTLSWTKGSRELTVNFKDMSTTVVDGTSYEILQLLTNAEIFFSCNLAKDNLIADDQGNIDIQLPGQVSAIKVTVSELKPKPPELVKSNAVIKEDGTAEWEITYTHPTAAYSGGKPTQITDTLPEGLEYASEIRINQNGTASTITKPTGNSFTYDVPNTIAAGTTVGFEYTTRLTNEEISKIWQNNGSQAKYTYKNNVKGTKDGADITPALAASGMLDVTESFQGFTAMKKIGKLIQPTSTDPWKIEWTITVNALAQSYKFLSVTDTLGKGLSLDKNSVKVNGNPTTIVSSVDNSKMTINLVENSNPLLSALTYTITYITEIDQAFFDQPENGDALTDVDVTNEAKLNYGWADSTGTGTGIGSGNYPILPSVVKPSEIGLSGDLISKKAINSYNPKTHELEWSVTINPNKVNITKALIEDDLSNSNPHHEFTDTAEAEIKKALTDALPSASPDVTITDNKLTIKLGAIGTQSSTFTYKTIVTDAEIWAGNVKDKEFSNTVKLLKSETKVNNVAILNDSVATATQKVTSNVLKKEHTDYNPNTKTLSWKLTVNENKTNLGKATITDALPDGISYIDGTAKINNAPFASPNSFSVNNNTITIELAKVNDESIITFDTIVDVNTEDFLNNATVSIKNKASIKTDSNKNQTDSNESTATISNNVLTKTAIAPTPEKPMVTYTVNLNPLDINLQQGLQPKELTLTDKLADGLYLDLTTVKLYNATRTQNTVEGVYTSSLAKGEAVLNPNINYSSADNLFSITIPDAKKAYILEYDAYIVKAGVSLSNNISLGGSIIPENSVNKEANKEVKLASFGSAGFALPRASFFSLQIKKKDENGNNLSGATFALYKNKTDTTPLLTTECDPATGTATLALPRTKDLAPGTKLYWKEIIAPTGYVANDEWHEITFTDPNDQSLPTQEFKNLPIAQATSVEIKIRKTDAQNNPLSGAEFALYKDELCTEIQQAAQAVDEKGELTFTNLYPGRNYWVKETKAPNGYYPIDNPVKITADTATTIHNIQNDVANVTLKITKTDKDNGTKRLQGAEFVLYLDRECTKPFAAKQITNAKGECVFTKLWPTTDYYIKEITAPSGYKRLTSVIKLTTGQNNTVSEIDILNTKLPPNAPPQAKENPKTGVGKP